MQNSALFLDVRTPGEFEELHIQGAVLHPLSDRNPVQAKELVSSKNGRVVICHSEWSRAPGW